MRRKKADGRERRGRGRGDEERPESDVVCKPRRSDGKQRKERVSSR